MPEALLLYRDWEGNTSHRQAKKMEVATYGIHTFMRRDTPEPRAMAQTHIVRKWHYCLSGIVVLTKEQTLRECKWKLFGMLPVWGKKEVLMKFL